MRKLIIQIIIFLSCVFLVSCSKNVDKPFKTILTDSTDINTDCGYEKNAEFDYSDSALSELVTSAETVIAGKKVEDRDKYGQLEMYLKYNWVNSNGFLISSESDKMNGPFFYMTIADLNLDNTPDIIVSQKYSNRTVQINDIYSINNGEVTYKASFYGSFNDNITIFKDEITQMLYFVCNSEVFQNQTMTNTLLLCSYNIDFSHFSCNPQLSQSKKEQTIIYRQYTQRKEMVNCTDFFSVWDFGENEEITNVITEDHYNVEYQNIFENLTLVCELQAFKTNDLIYDLFDDDEIYSSNEEVTIEMEKIINEYFFYEDHRYN